MNQPKKYLLVDDDASFANTLARALARRGMTVSIAHTSAEAIALANNNRFDRAIVDLKIDTDSGLDLIASVRLSQPALQIVMLTGYSSIATAVEAVKRGATNYLCKPASAEQILNAFNDDVDTAIPDTPPSVNRLEWEHIQRVLNEHDGNVSATARALGMHRRTLQRKLQKKPVLR